MQLYIKGKGNTIFSESDFLNDGFSTYQNNT